MTSGIEASDFVLVFLTQAYMDKVDSKGNDNCKLEFNHAYNVLGVERLIVVVMEADLRSVRKWRGPVSAALGSNLYYNYTSDDRLGSCTEGVVKELRSRTEQLLEDAVVT
jgi:hypothetical protein